MDQYARTATSDDLRKRDALMQEQQGVEMKPVYSDCLKASPARTVERFTLDNIDEAMKYQPWGWTEQQAGDIVREALTAAAKAILRTVPDSPYRSVALRNVLDARMNANAAISFRGRF